MTEQEGLRDRPRLTIVVPALNEAGAIEGVLRRLRDALAEVGCPAEVLVVDDGSRDETAQRAALVEGVRVLRNPVNLGYGHSLLRGIAASRGEVIGITDADGTYPVGEIPAMWGLIEQGADHVIGRRTGQHFRSHFSLRLFYRALCGYVCGRDVPDANSGLRLFRRAVVEPLRGDLCLGFSFTTSLTLTSLLSGHVVVFRDIAYDQRVGRSHVRPRDVLRTLQYLFQVIAVYNPLKLYLPLVLVAALGALVSGLYGVWLERIGGMISAVVLVATTLLLIAIAALAYVTSRVGLYPRDRDAWGVLAGKPGDRLAGQGRASDGPAGRDAPPASVAEGPRSP